MASDRTLAMGIVVVPIAQISARADRYAG